MPVAIYDAGVNKYLDALAIVLVSRDRYSLLPELHEIFGPDATLRFLDIFAGQTIVVPSREELQKAIRDIAIWVEMEDRGRTPAAKAHLAQQFGITEKDVWAIDRDMRATMDKWKIIVKKGGDVNV